MGLMLDALHTANWLHSKRGTKRPKPVRWPWVADDNAAEKTYGTAAPVTDIRDFLLFRNARAPELPD